VMNKIWIHLKLLLFFPYIFFNCVFPHLKEYENATVNIRVPAGDSWVKKVPSSSKMLGISLLLLLLLA
jgi:hypothetical protein